MIRCQKKVCLDDNTDRISDLPRNVIDNILRYLSIDDLVKTSILSRKWRYMWASVPQLEFDNDFFLTCECVEGIESSSIITEILLLHSGPLHKFTVHFSSEDFISVENVCINKWILFLSRKGVKVLELENLQEKPYQIPSHIFSCHDLTHIHLSNFELPPVLNFCGFKSLVDLHLFDIIFKSGVLESLVSGCPILVKLTVSYCSGYERIYVSSPALKSLHIEDDKVIKSICLKQAQNLTSLTLLADGPGDNIDRDWVTDLLKDLSKLKRISLGTGYIEILSPGVGINLPVLLKDVKHLELNGVKLIEARELLFIGYVLESSSNLEELVIKNNSEDVETQLIFRDFDCANFIKLQTVNITVKTLYEPALDFIRFVLASSPALEILTFKVDFGLSDAAKLLSISSDLLRMERASPRARVKLLHDVLIK
ncbi:F-box/FBD/LRR-repeat protein At1g13570 isoform X2 [Cajanus cajan]|nr:F-box/FBD/LRR-repeat protein At1g13570 isoform X2 [Cajanus cajan]